MSSPAVRSWRTAFLTLRDEMLTSPPRRTIINLINELIFTQSDSLAAAARDLPSHEVTSDFMLLMELARNISHDEEIQDVKQCFMKLSHLILGVSRCAVLEMSSTSWGLAIDSFKRIVEILLGKAKTNMELIGDVAAIKATKQCLESIRRLFCVSHSAASLSESEKLLNFLLRVVGYFEGESMYSYCSSDHSVQEILTVAFSVVGEVYSQFGSSVQDEIWLSTIEVLRKVMDILASQKHLLEDKSIAMFYIELLRCLHLVIANPRGGHLAGHVAGFVAALRIFLRYGLVNKSSYIMNQSTSIKGFGSIKSRSGPYRPPHLRKKVVENLELEDDESDKSSKNYFTSSDSDCSDNDGSASDNSRTLFDKARLGAIVCIQDLCCADPKSFTAQWPMLLPSSDVLQRKNHETTLMSCLLFDPYLKVRIASASTIMAMLDGPASVSLQVAEFRGSSKCGSFTSLSSSLGSILMQLHSGTLYLIKHETRSRLLELSFRILMLLISSTPYSRMSEDLLSTVISSLHSRIDGGFPFQSDQNSLMVFAVNCLTLALSVSPPLTFVNKMLLAEVSTGCQPKSGVLYTLFRLSESRSTPSISLEAFQALKALAHNYPNIMILRWEETSSIIYGVLSSFTEVSSRSWRGNVDHTIKERVISASIKVLDECLRAISGFKGTEDLSNDLFSDNPFTSDYVKTKTIASAPLIEDESKTYNLASERWSEVTVKHLPLIMKHSSPMIRAASVTCFAGMTSPVFFMLREDKQEFILSSCIDAALNDGVPSVRSAACRAIGVIACFPEISTEILERFIHTAKHNACDPLVSVRITASWALANICDSFSHHCWRENTTKISELISVLVDTTLQLANDNDKVKANAVRALGNLSRFFQFTSQTSNHNTRSFDWLEKMVHTFLSCVTTGNVKVQWNVCHALSNLFCNKTLKLQDMEWSSSVFSILLLLLRDSSNFKIKIQAASALSVPETINDYGRSYYDVVKCVVHKVETFKLDQISAPSNFKYWIALEKQLTSTLLHMIGLAAKCDHQGVQEFLIKKSSFLEVWLEALCSSLGDTNMGSINQKRDVLSRSIHSLIQVYERSNHHHIAQRFHRLANSIP